MAIPLSLPSKFKHIQFILQCLANIARLEMGHFMNTWHPARKMSSLCYTRNRENARVGQKVPVFGFLHGGGFDEGTAHGAEASDPLIPKLLS